MGSGTVCSGQGADMGRPGGTEAERRRGASAAAQLVTDVETGAGGRSGCWMGCTWPHWKAQYYLGAGYAVDGRAHMIDDDNMYTLELDAAEMMEDGGEGGA